ncbi:MAG: selenide, water dikinase SelD [Candidatus Zixiibacteriota bacterium]
MDHIYLDYNATTPIHPEVAEAMAPFLRDHFGNPSSSHWFGVQTRKAVETARARVAAMLSCNSDEIIFTSGGSESDNFAIAGYVLKNRSRGNHIVTSQIEHPAVLEICRYLEGQGFQVTYLSVDGTGMVDVEKLRRALRPTTILVSIMQANNEVGTIQPVKEIAEICHERGVAFHTDAAQAVGKIPVTIAATGADLITIAGHKLYAPKGIGALYVRRGIELQKLIHGAAHEQNLRAGTENVLEIVGLGKACEVVGREMAKQAPVMARLRDLLENELESRLPQCQINGDRARRLPNTLSVSFPGIEANAIISELEEVACSPGAACHSDKVMMSHVLEAMQVPVEYAMGTIRFSVGYMTTEAEIRVAADAIEATITRLAPSGMSTIRVADSDEEIRLTKYTHGLGCACKLRPQALEKILAQLPRTTDANVLVGSESSDDAAVYRLSEEMAVVQTVDFFTPIVDDPYHFGAIAAANALSDIYAMGGKPLFALSVVGFPSNRLPMQVLQQILKGAADKAAEAGINIIGGHTVDDTEPKYGLAVTGIVDPKTIKRNNTARVGDLLILTKPIGTGIISTAIKRQMVNNGLRDRVIKIMSTLNASAADVISRYDVSTCTDVTGFGLLGHLREVTVGSGVTARVDSKRVPIIDDAVALASSGVVPGGTENNLEYVSPIVTWGTGVSRVMKILLADAQTSGGLLMAVAKDQSGAMMRALIEKGVVDAAIVGEITGRGDGKISVV